VPAALRRRGFTPAAEWHEPAAEPTGKARQLNLGILGNVLKAAIKQRLS